MKHLVSVLAVLVLSVPALCQEREETNGSVNVIGEARISIAPDYIGIHIVAEEEDSDPAAAQEAVTREMKNILDFLRSRGDVDEVKTRVIQLQPRVRDYKSGEKHYNARQVVSFELKAVENYDELMLALLQKGIDGIHGVEFKSSEEEKYEKMLLQRAVVNAREKATLLAGELGQSIGKASYISDHFTAEGPRPVTAEHKLSASASSSIEAGEIELKASVNVQFQLH